VITGLENLRRLVHENMLPALERCSVILSRFAGIAKFQDSNDTVGFSSHQISLIMDTIACLHLVSSKILTQVVDELDLFASFSAWLRYEIDRLASNASGSSPNEETADKEASIDHSKVLLYLQMAMITSPLAVFFGDASSEQDNDWANPEQGVPMFTLLLNQLQKQEQGLPYMKHLPRVDFLSKNLAQQANVVFGQIAEAEKRNVLFGKANELGSVQSDAPLAMKICPIVC
jgi:anaphase-promoting complex subunit 4